MGFAIFRLKILLNIKMFMLESSRRNLGDRFEKKNLKLYRKFAVKQYNIQRILIILNVDIK